MSHIFITITLGFTLTDLMHVLTIFCHQMRQIDVFIEASDQSLGYECKGGKFSNIYSNSLWLMYNEYIVVQRCGPRFASYGHLKPPPLKTVKIEIIALLMTDSAKNDLKNKICDLKIFNIITFRVIRLWSSSKFCGCNKSESLSKYSRISASVSKL